jgi:hypothetical protein
MHFVEIFSTHQPLSHFFLSRSLTYIEIDPPCSVGCLLAHQSWLAAHPNFRYWQGVDSLCGPLLSLFWPDEALTFAVLSAITEKYLAGFLAPDNTACLNVYLATFCQVCSHFHFL